MLVGAAVLLSALAASGFASADERERCKYSAEQAQQLRDEGKYRRAREQMLVCARDVCPGPIKSDCGTWLTELDRDAPTVVFGARDAHGNDVPDVKVSMDGVVLSERLDGKPVLVDSGEHTFKFEAKDGTVKEQKLLLRAAEKARPINVDFGSGAPATAQVTVSGRTVDKNDSSILPIAIVGGIGVVGLASFAVFGIGGSNDVSDLQKCKPNCAETDVDHARTKLIVADISLGVGVVALAVATYMYLTRPKADAQTHSASTLRLDAGPATGGGLARLVGTF